jgi:hypothetical protein
MLSLEEQCLKLFDELITEGEALPLENYEDKNLDLRRDYNAWKASCLAAFKAAFGSDSPHYQKLDYSFNLKNPEAEKKYALKLLEKAKKDYPRLSLIEKLKIENREKTKQTRIFISYQQDHAKVACNIQDIILRNSDLKKENVFVGIEISP